MGVVEQILMSKRQLNKVRSMKLNPGKALSFVCDDVILMPVKPKICKCFKNIDAVLCANGTPIVRLDGGGDVAVIEPTTESLKIDVLTKSKLTRIFPTYGRLRVDWDGMDLHITRLSDVAI